MAAVYATEMRPANQTARSANELVSAEDAAFALIQLQRRIAELERENVFLRDCIPAFIAAAPQPLASLGRSG